MKEKTLIVCALFLLSILIVGQNLNKPFWGEHDWNGVRYGNIARNYLRYGTLDLNFAQIENSGPLNTKREYFTHYPPLLPLLIALSYKIFGISEWSTRIVPLFATSGSVALIFLMGSKLWNLKTGILASLLALSLPMNIYFGKTPVHEPLVVFFVLLSFLAYLYLLSSGKLIFKIWFIVALIAAHFTTWAGFFLLPAMMLVLIIKRDKFLVKRLIPYWLIPIVIFPLYLIFSYLQTGSLIGGDLLGAFLQRSSISRELQPTDFNFINYLGKIRLWFFSLYSGTLALIVFFWFIYHIIKKFGKADLQLLTLLLFGIPYFVFFPNAAFIHNYLVIYFMPFFVLAGSRAIWSLVEIKLFKRFIFLIPLILFLIFFERKPFLDALNKSQGDKFAVEVGLAINKQTNLEDVILISPFKFSYSADKFLRFYSDRKLIYSDRDDVEHNVAVLVDTDSQKFEIIRK